MPWTTADVDKHKKGLSDKGKKQWCRIANSVLAKCMKDGGSEESCAVSAIKQANGVVNTNSLLYSVYKNKVEGDYEVQLKIHQEKAHLVVPVVMMVEGVLNGSHGPLLHLTEDFGKFPEAWNGIPVVIDHPEKDGVNISANYPDVIDNRAVGKVYNANIEDKKLKAELWLDEEKLNTIAPETLADINNNKLLEVSVGVFTEEDEQPGVYEEKEYDSIARNHRPDHLAILTECAGACSIEDGCGLGANATVTGMEKKRAELKMSVSEFYAVPRDPPSDSKLPIFDAAHVRNAMARFNQTQGLSAEEKASAKSKIRAKAKHFGIDVTNFEETRIIERGNHNKDIQPSQNIGKAGVGNVNNENSVKSKKEDKMSENKCPKCVEKINALIANKESGFVETDREMLNALTEPQLDKLVPKTITKEVPVEVNKLTPEQTDAIAWANAQKAAKKAELVQGIQANTSKELWPDDELKVMTEGQLERLFKFVKKEEVVDYSAIGSYTAQSNSVSVVPLYPAGVVIEEIKK